MNCIKRYEEIYQKSPEGVVFCPYRICPIGAHSDHQLGKITGLTIDRGVYIAYSTKKNGVCELMSEQFSKRAQWHVFGVPAVPDGDWADYLRGATIALARRFPHTLKYGISAVIEGTLPIGGLSSSAAVTIAFLTALCRVNDIVLSEHEMVMTALEAENSYVGVNCGKLDQSCEVYSKKDHLLYLDTLDDSYELIPKPSNMPSFKVAVFFSGVERTLAGSKFNMRVDECRAAAYALLGYSGAEYGKFGEANLRDVPREVYEEYKSRLPMNWAMRAEHWYTEYDRVLGGVDAWRRGDIAEFGKLSFESGYSSIHNWQTGSPELKSLYEAMLHTDGIYGGRFSGAGFKGCCMAIIDPSFEESILTKIEDEYLAKFPELRGKYSGFICDTADGASLMAKFSEGD